MKRFLKIAAWTAGILVLLILAAGGFVYVFATSDYVRAQVENHANAMYGRKTKIGSIAIDWGSTSHIRLTDAQLSNTDWGKADHMFKAEEVEIDIRLWPLLKGDFVLPRLVLHKPDIALERNAEGKSNWSPEESPMAGSVAQAVQPETRSETPLISRIEIDGGHVTYTDMQRRLDLEGEIQTATGQAGAEPQTELALKGKLEGRPLTLHFTGGSALMLRDTSIPYPADLDIGFGNTRLKVKGTVQDPFKFTGADLQLSLSGSDLADIYVLLGIPGPPTPPYQITGHLTRDGDVWHVADMKLHAGKSDLAGKVTIDQSVKPPHLTADLVSDHLVFADLAPLTGASSDEGTPSQPAGKNELFPDVPLHLERMQKMDMDVTLDARKVIAPSYVPIDAFKVQVKIKDGQLLAKPVDIAFGGGRVTGEFALQSQSDSAKLITDLRLKGVRLETFFRDSPFFDTTKATLGGRVSLAGSGRSLADVMNTAEGDIAVAMDDGWVSGLMVSLAGLQIGDALVLYVTGDNKIPVHCALARLTFDHGTVAFDKTLLDTEKSVLHVEGKANLETQAIKVKIEADPKHFDLLDIHAPVLVEGTMKDPKISIDQAIPIPTPDLGGAEDVPCEQMTQQLFAAKPAQSD
ncbi:membrane protein [Hypericibacter adhaerens]|uniref:Membrane protein n=1 Tax=Hypericibacter adhaerens TaxID=2602016 RepID=A0A5J6N5L5_9PROT|nr:AsmA family protein [Hypericibacter adhaerens]QEX23963.1 membrane protein [Hypericibacter adhaerens]